MMKLILSFFFLLFCYPLYSQSISLFDIDVSGYPTIKAKFYLFDKNGKQITDVNPNEFKVYENGSERQITNISCPSPQPAIPISSVLTIDISNSMQQNRLDIAKAAAEVWIDGLSDDSECAITSFDNFNYLNQDFTKDKNKLNNAINLLTANTGTDYDMGFVEPKAGALLIAQTGQYKRAVVFLTDGLSNKEPKLQYIINMAKANLIQVYVVTLNMECPLSLKTIATETSGMWFENVSTIEEARKIYLQILGTVQGSSPCEIEWESETFCEIGNVQIELFRNSLMTYSQYIPPPIANSSLKVKPHFISLGKRIPSVNYDTTITLTATNASFKVLDIVRRFGTLDFTVVGTAFPLTIPNNTSKDITLRFKTPDSSMNYATIEILTETCSAYLSASAGFPGQESNNQTLKLLHPNGGEVFVVGSDTLITWEGIAPTDTVKIEYSNDNGLSWNLITEKATNLKYVWKDIPKPPSNECLIRIEHLTAQSGNYGLLKTLTGHTDWVYKAKWSPDGSRLASASADNTARIWNVQTGQILQTLTGHSWSVHDISWSPNGRNVATASWDFTVKIWDAITGQLLQEIKDNKSSVYSVDWSPDGSRIASVGSDKVVYINNINNGQLEKILTGHSADITSVSWNPDASKIITGSVDKTARIWDVASGTTLHTLSGNQFNISSVDWSPNGSFVATSSENLVEIWNATDGTLIKSLTGHTNLIHGVSWSPKSEMLATASRDRSIGIWDVASGKLLNSLIGHNFYVNSVDWNPDGSLLASASDDNTVRIWYPIIEKPQVDISDSLFAIVMPELETNDIDMLKVVVGSLKDSIVTDFIINKGKFPFKVLSIEFRGVDANAFQLVSYLPKYIINENNSFPGEFRFIPNRVGIHTAEIVIITQADTLISNIRGEGVQPSLDIINKIIDFGKVYIGYYKDTLQVITIKNIGSVPINITKTLHSGPNALDFTTINGGGNFVLQANETAYLDLRFEPKFQGRTSGMLEFYFDGVGSPYIIQLFGEGISDSPVIDANVEELYSLVCENTLPINIEVKNIGGKTLIISDINLYGASTNEFSLDIQTPLYIEPGDNDLIMLEFTPTSLGSKTVELEIISNSIFNSVLTLNLSAIKDTVLIKPDVEVFDLGLLCPNEIKEFLLFINNSGSIESGAFVQLSQNLETSNSEFYLNEKENYNLPITFKGLSTLGLINENIFVYDSICNNVYEVKIIGEIIEPEINVEDITISSFIGVSKDTLILFENNTGKDLFINEVPEIYYPFEFVGESFPLLIPANGTAELPFRYTAQVHENDSINLIIHFEPCGLVIELKIIGKPISAIATLKVGDISAEPGEVVEMPIFIHEQINMALSGITSFDIDLSYNSTLLYPIDFIPQIIDETTSQITINDIPYNSDADNILTVVRFKVGLGNAEQSEMIPSNIRANGGEAVINSISGQFTLLGICYEGDSPRLLNPNSNAGILNITPNPAENYLHIDFKFMEKGFSEIKILNYLGETVKTVFSKEIDDVSEFGRKSQIVNINNLATGQYLLVFRTATMNECRNLIIIK